MQSSTHIMHHITILHNSTVCVSNELKDFYERYFFDFPQDVCGREFPLPPLPHVVGCQQSRLATPRSGWQPLPSLPPPHGGDRRGRRRRGGGLGLPPPQRAWRPPLDWAPRPLGWVQQEAARGQVDPGSDLWDGQEGQDESDQGGHGWIHVTRTAQPRRQSIRHSAPHQVLILLY